MVGVLLLVLNLVAMRWAPQAPGNIALVRSSDPSNAKRLSAQCSAVRTDFGKGEVGPFLLTFQEGTWHGAPVGYQECCAQHPVAEGRICWDDWMSGSEQLANLTWRFDPTSDTHVLFGTGQTISITLAPLTRSFGPAMTPQFALLLWVLGGALGCRGREPIAHGFLWCAAGLIGLASLSAPLVRTRPSPASSSSIRRSLRSPRPLKVGPAAPLLQYVRSGSHDCALDADGRLRFWGRGWEGQLGYGSNAPVNPAERALLRYGAFVEGGREKLAKDPKMREEFFDRIFEPMLNVTDDPEFDDTVVAWEPVNEPNWCTRYWLSNLLVPRGSWNCTPGIELAEMQAFLDGAVARILAHRKRKSGHHYFVTHGFTYGLGCRVGAASLGLALKDVSDENSTPFSVSAAGNHYLRQFHYYPGAMPVVTPGMVIPRPPQIVPFPGLPFPGGSAYLPPISLARVELRNDLPLCLDSGDAFLGEFSTTKPDWSTFLSGMDPQYLSWRRLNGKDEAEEYEATYWRLVYCHQQKYQLVFLWPNRLHGSDPTDPDNAITQEALRAVDDYLGGTTVPTI